MAVNIPAAALRQARQQLTLDSSARRGLRIQYKHADFDALKTAALTFARGDEVETGWALDSWSLDGVPGGGGVLTLSCAPTESTSQGSPRAARAVWSCRSARNDVSILAYCGTSDANPSREWIELWQKEADADVARSGNYTKPDGTVSDLSQKGHAAATSELMAKIASGVDSVVRFHPVLTCTSTWSRVPSKFLERVGFIDDPAAPEADETIAPSNLSSVIGHWEWLKVQDDVSETGDGRWQRVESWMGADSWDEDLYGADRWPMPYTHS